MKQIISMHRFASRHVVILSCGHRLEVCNGDVDKQQLFIGKRMKCEECEKENQ